MFLSDLDPRTLSDKAPAGLSAAELFLGSGDSPLQVAVFESARAVTKGELRALHDDRKRGGVAPVVIVALYAPAGGGARAALGTNAGLEFSALEDLEAAQAERICRSALGAPDRHAAYRVLASAIQQLRSPIPGLRNAGLFAMHELESGVTSRRDWKRACDRARGALALSGKPLVEKLGFAIEQLPGPAAVLKTANRRVAVAVFLQRADQIEPSTPLFDQLSPISYALAKADEHNLEYVVVSAGTSLRVYPVKPGIGTGRRGRTETYVELDLALLRESEAGYLHLLASADALEPEGSFSEILGSSKEFAVKLGERLRDRVYEEAVPGLARAIVQARALKAPTPEKLAETYEMALLALFRLLFVAYAEDKELLPLHSSNSYRQHSLKEISLRLAREHSEGAAYGEGDHYWTEVRQLWKAIDHGNRAWHVPAYNGGLFSPDSTSASRALEKLTLPDSAFAPALRALLLDATSEGVLGPVDFRSLGVREFGTIYEGLLEQELAVAERDLSVERRTGAYVPAKRGVPVVVEGGQVYLHNASGARKASGAYYTKDFAVEHLLDRALDPALEEHLARLAARYDDREKSEGFFDFHVADIAMGSGHFLVAAIDHIERKLSGFLAKHPLAGVRNELERLRTSAREALGDEYRGDAIEDTQLLRRQIARRCIHGVDLNPLSVELARLSIWIHTFVPGLPLSFLDQNLVVGNSLVGIATFAEARDLMGSADDLFSLSADEMLSGARAPLEKLARLADATVAEVKEAQALYATARDAIRPTEELFTILAASRIDEPERGDTAKERAERLATVVKSLQLSALSARQRDAFAERLVRRAEYVLAGMKPLHFPVAFPGVFLRERAGFDVVLGNPPWEEATLEEDAFWARHSPGLRGLPQREQEAAKDKLRRQRPDLVAEYEKELAQANATRAMLVNGPFPGMGTGDPDLYKAFAWRFWDSVNANGGRLGVVLPRSAFSAKGSTEWRRALFEKASLIDLTQLLNTGGWVFDEAHFQYTIGLAVIKRGELEGPNIMLDGPYSSLARFRAPRVAERRPFWGKEVAEWNDALALPLLPSESSVDVFLKLRSAPRLDLDDGTSWRARPHTDLHATNDKGWMDLESEQQPTGYWPVMKGESFDLWTPDTGRYYAWADPKPLLAKLQEKRERSARSADSVFAGFDAAWVADLKTLPAMRPRIAFRDITNRTNTRTVVTALVPPGVFLTNKAPYLVLSRALAADEAYLLGVLSSIPFDWYARRFVETTLNFFIFNPFPVPRPASGSALRARVVALAARLATPDDRFEEWAAQFKLKPKVLVDDEKVELIAELDAAVSHLYGLNEKDVRHIFETFHEGWNYDERLKAVLRHFKTLKGQS